MLIVAEFCFGSVHLQEASFASGRSLARGTLQGNVLLARKAESHKKNCLCKSVQHSFHLL